MQWGRFDRCGAVTYRLLFPLEQRGPKLHAVFDLEYWARRTTFVHDHLGGFILVLNDAFGLDVPLHIMNTHHLSDTYAMCTRMRDLG